MPDYEPSVVSEQTLLACPNGHTTWTTADGHYWCHECSEMHDVDPEFDKLHDPNTGDPVSSNEVTAP